MRAMFIRFLVFSGMQEAAFFLIRYIGLYIASWVIACHHIGHGLAESFHRLKLCQVSIMDIQLLS